MLLGEGCGLFGRATPDADFPEVAFAQKTAAAILVLLGFLIAMNAIAVFLRKRFERRW